jgi:hypothetical protein
LKAMHLRTSPVGVVISTLHCLISRKSEKALSPTITTPRPLMSKASTTVNVVLSIFSSFDDATVKQEPVNQLPFIIRLVNRRAEVPSEWLRKSNRHHSSSVTPAVTFDGIGCRTQGPARESRIAIHPIGRSDNSTTLGSWNTISSNATILASVAHVVIDV